MHASPGAGELPARAVIHAVGPVWSGGANGEPELLRTCYERAVELAASDRCETIALPAISTGAFSYPLEPAARIAVSSVKRALADHPAVREARFWLFDAETHSAFERALTTA